MNSNETVPIPIEISVKTQIICELESLIPVAYIIEPASTSDRLIEMLKSEERPAKNVASMSGGVI